MLRFTIRDTLLTTVIAALAAGWFVDHRSADREHGLDCAGTPPTAGNQAAAIIRLLAALWRLPSATSYRPVSAALSCYGVPDLDRIKCVGALCYQD